MTDRSAMQGFFTRIISNDNLSKPKSRLLSAPWDEKVNFSNCYTKRLKSCLEQSDTAICLIDGIKEDCIHAINSICIASEVLAEDVVKFGALVCDFEYDIIYGAPIIWTNRHAT